MESRVRKCKSCEEIKDLEDFGKHQSGYRHKCKVCLNKQKNKNRDYAKEYKKALVSGRRELEREKRRKYAAKVRKEHPWKKRYYESLRRTRKLNATPQWADMTAIKEFYKNCPKGYHVDHIHPLNGEEICGLHVLKNLQYLPAELNLKKGNRFNGSNNG